MSDVNEKLHELQESMQKLQLLKQLGAEKLILEQEKEIYTIQRDIMHLDNNTSIDIFDAVLPKKCKFCTVKTTDEERLECFEKIGTTCKRKEPKHVNMLNMSIFKVVLMYMTLLAVLFTFLLFTNILFNYFEEKLLVFGLASAGLLLVIVLFKSPVKKLYSQF